MLPTSEIDSLSPKKSYGSDTNERNINNNRNEEKVINNDIRNNIKNNIKDDSNSNTFITSNKNSNVKNNSNNSFLNLSKSFKSPSVIKHNENNEKSINSLLKNYPNFGENVHQLNTGEYFYNHRYDVVL